MDWISRQLSQHGDGAGEDRLGIALMEGALFVVVCDGAGGIPGGARAADLAVSALLRGLPDDPLVLLAEADALLEADPLAGECTAVIVRLSASEVEGASCGDSAAFVDGVEVTVGQHRKRRLGSGQALPVPFSGPAAQRTLVCTDGLSAVVRPEAIAQATGERTLTRAADRLVAQARLLSGQLQDDLAFVLVEVGSRAVG